MASPESPEGRRQVAEIDTAHGSSSADAQGGGEGSGVEEKDTVEYWRVVAEAAQRRADDAEILAEGVHDQYRLANLSLQAEVEEWRDTASAREVERDEVFAALQELDAHVASMEAAAPPPPAQATQDGEGTAELQARLDTAMAERDDAIGARFMLQTELRKAEMEVARLKDEALQVGGAPGSTAPTPPRDKAAPSREQLQDMADRLTSSDLREQYVRIQLDLTTLRSTHADTEIALEDTTAQLIATKMQLAQLQTELGSVDEVLADNASLKQALLATMAREETASKARSSSTVTRPKPAPAPSQITAQGGEDEDEDDLAPQPQRGVLGGISSLWGMLSLGGGSDGTHAPHGRRGQRVDSPRMTATASPRPGASAASSPDLAEAADPSPYAGVTGRLSLSRRPPSVPGRVRQGSKTGSTLHASVEVTGGGGGGGFSDGESD